MSSRDVYDELIKSGISQKELDEFFSQQKDFKNTSKMIRDKNVSMGLNPITPRAYNAQTLYNYVNRTGKSVKTAIKDIKASQSKQKADYDDGSTSQINTIVESSLNEIETDFVKPENVAKTVGSKISKDDLEYLQKLNAELTRYKSVLENEAIPQHLYNAITNIIDDIKAEIYNVIASYL